jgi:hypothetical protein
MQMIGRDDIGQQPEPTRVSCSINGLAGDDFDRLGAKDRQPVSGHGCDVKLGVSLETRNLSAFIVAQECWGTAPRLWTPGWKVVDFPHISGQSR